jgi:tryptophan synthase beta subunit
LKVYESQVGPKFKWDKLLAYADDMNLLGYNISTIKKIAETLTDASKEVGLEINVEETKYMLNGIGGSRTGKKMCKMAQEMDSQKHKGQMQMCTN